MEGRSLKKTKGKGGRGRRGNRGAVQVRPPRGWSNSVIPMYNPSTLIRRKIRYQCLNSGGTFNVCGAGLLDAMFVATGGTAGFRVFSSVRIRSVRMWTSGSQSTTLNTSLEQSVLAIEWTSSEYQKDTKLEVNPLGVEVAQLYSVPPLNSSVSWWITSGGVLDHYISAGGSVCNIQCGVGTIIDLDLEMLMIDDEIALSVIRGVTGASTGKFYYSPLDVTVTGSGNLIPQAVNTI